MSLPAEKVDLCKYFFLLVGGSPLAPSVWTSPGSTSPLQPSPQVWPKKEPQDVEMNAPAAMEIQPASNMDTQPITDVLFTTPETWISSLPSERTHTHHIFTHTHVHKHSTQFTVPSVVHQSHRV